MRCCIHNNLILELQRYYFDKKLHTDLQTKI